MSFNDHDISMPLSDFLTAEVLGLILTIAGLFGGAMFWLGVLHQRLKTLEKNTGTMQEDLKQLTIKFEADLLARRAEEERRKEEKREKKQDV
jgi:hypothetical protein